MQKRSALFMILSTFPYSSCRRKRVCFPEKGFTYKKTNPFQPFTKKNIFPSIDKKVLFFFIGICYKNLERHFI